MLKRIVLSFLLVSLVIAPIRAESLWLKSTTDEYGMFAQRKARRVGDILTVEIQESMATAIKMSNTQAKNFNSNNNPLQLYLFGKISHNYRGGLDSYKLATDSNHTATVQQGIDQQSVTTTFSVTVIDVLPNKNLVLEGVRCLRFSDETVFTTLRGLVRSDDVSATNTIGSEKIADMHVEVRTEGSMSASIAKGLLQRANDTINFL